MAERRQGSDDALPGLGQGVPDAIPERRRPLASRMRPRNLAEVVGHAALLGPEALLPRLIKSDTFGSLLFYGPPGCGKTTLAEVIAAETQSFVVRVNAVLSGTPELREILADARRQPSRKTVLVVDEIHRFNKAQQDLLLPDVEAGVVRLIGCTSIIPGSTSSRRSSAAVTFSASIRLRPPRSRPSSGRRSPIRSAASAR